jgi:chromosome segregation ATPase
LNDLEKKYRQLAKDYRNAIWNRARTNISAAKELTESVSQQLESLTNTIDQIHEIKNRLQGEADKFEQSVDNMKSLLTNMDNDYQSISENIVPELNAQREQLLNITKQGSKQPHQLMLNAEDHAKKLEHEARRLKQSFSDIEHSSNALSAAKAYAEISDALKSALAAAEKAQTSANQAQQLVDRSSPDSTVNLANSTLAASRSLENTVLDAENKDDFIVKSNNQLKKTLERVKALELKGNENITRIKEAQNILEDHNDRINNVNINVEDASKKTSNAEQMVNTFSEKVAALTERVEALNNFNVRNINDQIANITLSKSTIDNMVRSLQDAKSRASKHETQMKDIRRDLNVLKEKINEAREKASKIRIAVKSEPEQSCSREYISPLSPSPSNTIILKYRPSLDSADSLIFFTGTQGTRTQNREYIAVELKSKKINVSWNIGGGRRYATITKRNIAYIPASDRNTWYNIEINR